jgi:hypothetical protein
MACPRWHGASQVNTQYAQSIGIHFLTETIGDCLERMLVAAYGPTSPRADSPALELMKTTCPCCRRNSCNSDCVKRYGHANSLVLHIQLHHRCDLKPAHRMYASAVHEYVDSGSSRRAAALQAPAPRRRESGRWSSSES